MEVPSTYRLVFKDKQEVARETMEFRFEKPDGFIYSAGQSMRLKIPGTDEERTLSIVTAPHEEGLVFAMRMRGSEFKKRLKRLSQGESVIASGPNGEFGLHKEEAMPSLYIAGGIGITAFISILSHIEHNKLKNKVTLLYSNRTREDISYYEKLRTLSKNVPNVRVVFVLTKESRENWHGESMRIDAEMIKGFVPDVSRGLFFVAATPEMVERMHDVLVTLGATPENIYSKRFKGY